MKWIKRVGIVVGLIVVLFSVGLALVYFYKKEILAEVSAQLKSAVHAEVVVGDVDITLFEEFPNFTLRLDNVFVRDTSARPGDPELFKTRTILLNLRTYKLFFKEVEFKNVEIHDGDVFIFRNTLGHSNLDAFRRQDTTQTTSDSTQTFQLTHEKIRFENVRFSYHDSLRNKFIEFRLAEVNSEVTHDSVGLTCKLQGAIDFGQLTFNVTRGSFLKDQATEVDLSFRYSRDSAKLVLHPSSLALKESRLELKGMFDFSENRTATLDISSNNLVYMEGLSVLPSTMRTNLSSLALEQPFGIDVHLETPLQPGSQPFVRINFDLRHNTFKSKPVTITDLSLKGIMTNQDDPALPFGNLNSTVRLHEVEGKVDELPFEAEAVLSNFDHLDLEIFSKHRLSLPDLNREVDTTMIKFNGGLFTSEFHYKGSLNEYFDELTGTYTGTLEGKAHIEDATVTLIARQLKFSRISTDVRFNKDTVWIDRFNASSSTSSAKVSGMIINFVPFFTPPSKKGFVRLRISSPNIDMANFLVKKTAKKKSAKELKKDRQRVSDVVDKMFTMLEFDVDVAIDKFKNKQFQATALKGKLRLKGNTLEGKDMKMTFGGGKLNLSATMKELNKPINPLAVKAVASGIAVKKLFQAFNNFGLTSVTDQNLEGTISFDTRLRIRVDDDFNLLMPSLSGDVNLSLRDGRLINVDAIHNMSSFLFKRRDFDDVKFAEIKAKVGYAHRDLDISRMEVQSSVLSFFVEGRYSLDNRTELQIQLPLSNLRKRDKTFVPKNVGVDAKVGPSVFLLAKTDEKGKTELNYLKLRIKN